MKQGVVDATKIPNFSAVKPAVKKLFWRGKDGWDESWFDHAAAVVGSRRITEYGRRVVDKIVPQLVNGGATVISGMMYGVDQAAHRACMASGGRTVAVLGWGIDYKGITAEDLSIMNEIIEKGGLVVSEWEDQAGTLWTFPQRDRIMAALADEVYVVEAAVKSGSMITVEWAIKLGKRVWAVPGPVTSRVSDGTNRLIAEKKAQMWLPEQQVSQRTTNDAKSDDKNADIYRLLENETLTVDELARKLMRSVNEMGAQLSVMTLSGEIKEKDGKYFIGG